MTSNCLPPEVTGPESQREVQRLLGRCMVRIQQYEKSLKFLLTHHELAGPAETLQAQAAMRAEKLATLTLGQLAGLLFESFVVTEEFERDLLPDHKIPADRISFAHSTRLPQSLERREQTKAAMQELVTLRNELVHHFLYRFDIWCEQGCTDAIAYLQEAYQRIDARYQELRAWLMAINKGKEALASFVQSKVFKDWLFNGIHPDGSFEWGDTGIVRALREELRSLAGEDWIAFDVVKARMLERHPDQTPQKYRCSSWQQVLAESCEFDLMYRPGLGGGQKQAWVRLRPELLTRKKRNAPGRGPQTPPATLSLGSG